MKNRFTTIDIRAALSEISKSDAVGLRVVNVYDIDNKTYLVRVAHADKKFVILIESGNRIHLTEYDWPKNMLPSAFSMKCRKHLKGRRLASVKQLGIDRIIDFQFGFDEAAYHLIVELYDRGNIILTDYEYTILQLLRMRTDTDKDVKFAVREKYPWDLAKQHESIPTLEQLKLKLENAKDGEQLKRVLNPIFIYGGSLLEHALLEVGIQPNIKVNQQFHVDNEQDMEKLLKAINIAESILLGTDETKSGYIIQKREAIKKDAAGEPVDEYLSNNEFHPILYNQHKNSMPYVQFPSFNKAVDEFFSKLECQKIDLKALQQERGALKRLENVKQDHVKRIEALQTNQDNVMRKAELIEINLPWVDQAITTINSAIANQVDWVEIEELVAEAKLQNDPVASLIKSLQLSSNKITLILCDILAAEFSSSEDEDEGTVKNKKTKTKKEMINVEIDLSLTAFGNARRYHNSRRQAASKEQKTMQASKKALKSAEKKAHATLKEVQTSKLINKVRKTYWFEKFFWFITSENYLVIGGRDQQQNELIVKRYLRAGDIYVHADLHGASSVILKNPSGGEVPPKTLNEAGTMAICYSAAWEARVVTSAWWVYHHQVSKTAPSGEYLSTGSFMIRGKKNYLPPSHLIMGYSVLFKLDEASITNHVNDRKVRGIEDAPLTRDKNINIEELVDVVKEADNKDKLYINKDTSESKREAPTGEKVSCATDKSLCDTINESTVTVDVDRSEDDHENSLNTLDKSDLDKTKEQTDLSESTVRDASSLKENIYPDTSIQLQHIYGDVYQPHGPTKQNEQQLEGEHFVYLGDNEKVSTTKQESQTRKPKISAKQKRDLKKKRNKSAVTEETEIEEQTSEEKVCEKKDGSIATKPATSDDKQSSLPNNSTAAIMKRGQKSKQKRMEKYKDQDEEDRELMQQMHRANEPEKPPKRKGKNKHKETNKQAPKPRPLINEPEMLFEQSLVENPSIQSRDNDDNEEDDTKENINVLDSLTGCPLDEDILLYAVPVCAPYTCLTSYKYKMKLTPGTGKRGKAAKTAIHMFQTASEASSWEKDLFKNLKDCDISRNIPGKVKVSAPNLNKSKKK